MNFNKNKGMSLIELLIVMAIVAIIAAVAYPSYQDYMIKARRADATGDTLELAQYLERYYTENGRYDQDRNGVPLDLNSLPIQQSPANGTAHYTIVPVVAQTTYTITTTPVSAVQQNDTRCAVLSLNEQAVRCTAGGAHCSNSGNAADTTEVNYCW